MIEKPEWPDPIDKMGGLMPRYASGRPSPAMNTTSPSRAHQVKIFINLRAQTRTLLEFGLARLIYIPKNSLQAVYSFLLCICVRVGFHNKEKHYSKFSYSPLFFFFSFRLPEKKKMNRFSLREFCFLKRGEGMHNSSPTK